MKRIVTRAIAVLSAAERGRLLRMILASAVVSIADIGALAMLIGLLRFYTEPSHIPSSTPGKMLVGLQDLHFLLPLVVFLLLFVIKNLASFLLVKAQYRFIYQVASRISRQNMLRYLNGSYSDYAQVNPSVHVGTVGYQPNEFSTYILSGIQQLFTEVILTTTAIVAILLFNARLFVLLLLVLLPPVIISSYFSRKRLNAARRDVKVSAEKASQHLNESLSAYIESNIYDRKRFFVDRFSRSQRRLATTLSQLQITQAIPPRFIEVFAVFGLLVLILVNKFNGGAAMELVNIGAFMAAAYKIIPGITRIANAGAQMRMYQHSIDSVKGQVGEAEVRNHQVGIESIRFQNVTFRHNDNSDLLHFDMEASRGDLIGISSDSGKGKTTLVNLLLGFLAPHEGRICINGKAMGEEERKEYWPDISYVKQQTFLIHDTIRRNITLEEELTDSQALQQAIYLAGLEEFIASIPEGIETVVTDEGKNISGGQRQRIALARAFYKKSTLIILDEPFSEMDATLEQAILRHLQSLQAEGHIILLITHNRSSLQYCNKIISVNE